MVHTLPLDDAAVWRHSPARNRIMATSEPAAGAPLARQGRAPHSVDRRDVTRVEQGVAGAAISLRFAEDPHEGLFGDCGLRRHARTDPYPRLRGRIRVRPQTEGRRPPTACEFRSAYRDKRTGASHTVNPRAAVPAGAAGPVEWAGCIRPDRGARIPAGFRRCLLCETVHLSPSPRPRAVAAVTEKHLHVPGEAMNDRTQKPAGLVRRRCSPRATSGSSLRNRRGGCVARTKYRLRRKRTCVHVLADKTTSVDRASTATGVRRR